jgi:hypothetical protein
VDRLRGDRRHGPRRSRAAPAFAAAAIAGVNSRRRKCGRSSRRSPARGPVGDGEHALVSHHLHPAPVLDAPERRERPAPLFSSGYSISSVAFQFDPSGMSGLYVASSSSIRSTR